MLSTTSRPFFQEPLFPKVLRDSILTLLGPSPNSKVTPRPHWRESLHDVQAQRLALIAYRAKIVALINILEVGVKTAEKHSNLKELWSGTRQPHASPLQRRKHLRLPK
jgi:hypothetical protein